MAQSLIDDIATAEDNSFPDGLAKIKVIGVGGGGGNALKHMISEKLAGVEFVAANTDLQDLKRHTATTKIRLGEKLTKGLGAGAKPEKGREAALESVEEIKRALGDADMVFITAGMGGGTGTGASPVIANIAKDMGKLTVGVVTKPFSFEGPRKMRAAEEGLELFKEHVDCLITIPNDNLLAFAPKGTSFPAMLQKANEVLLYAVKGICDVIVGEGAINVDFADVQTIMSESGLALMGIGKASGENRASEAVRLAIQSPLLDGEVSLESAKAVLYNITASREITMEEVNTIGSLIYEAIPDSDNVNIIFGVIYDDSLGDELHVTVIATGIEPLRAVENLPVEQPAAKVTSFEARSQAGKLQTKRQSPLQQGNLVPTVQEPVEQRPVHPYASQQAWIGEHSNIPAYERKKMAQGLTVRPHNPGQVDFTYDEDDLEVPTFIRRLAD